MASAALDEEARLGRDLAELLRRLRENRSPEFSIGPQEAIDSHRLVLTLLSTQPVPDGLRAFADTLAPVLARSPEQRRAFERIIAEIGPAPPAVEETETPEGPQEDGTGPTAPPPEVPRWKKLAATLDKGQRRGVAAIALIALIVLAVVLARYWTVDRTPPTRPQPRPVEEQTKSGPEPVSTPVPLGETLANRAPTASIDAVERVRYAASIHYGAPTLREIARALARTASVPLDPDEYLRRLRALTGLPADRPLPVAARSTNPAFVGWTERAIWAVGEIEHPGQASMDEARGNILAAETAGRFSRLGDAPELGMLGEAAEWRGVEPSDRPPTTVAELNPTVRARYPGDVLARAYALHHPNWNPPDAPWLPQAVPEPSAPAAGAWVAALAFLVLALAALLPLLDPRRAFLRRRPPRVRPERAQLIQTMPQAMLGGTATYREIRKALQRREPRPTRQLDIRATIRATVRAGSGAIVPRLGATRSAPDYLVLIERRSLSDLEADRAAALIAPLRTGAIGVDLYFFNSDPSRAYSERGGSAVTIEELMARYPHHRLILMASGEQMLDLYSDRARGGYAKLGHWRRRGLLTPIPRREWAREESLIAAQFGAPMARSTSSGMVVLAHQLLAEGGLGAQLLGGGDEGAPPLPPGLAELLENPPRNPESAPPDYVDELMAELRWYPDGPGFEWLCALAVYPAATFDLALYLGLRLPEWPGAPAERTLYSPARLAGLTRLPWLREGRIPAWLRRELIARLAPDRAAQVRGAILALIESAEATDRETGGRAGFGQEPGRGPAPQRLFDDEVLVDFLRQGKAEDLEIDLPRPKHSLRALIERIDGFAAAAAALAAAYAAAAWYVSPGPGDGAALLPQWLPLLLLAAAGAVAAILIRPASAGLTARKAAIRLAAAAFLAGILAIVALIERTVAFVAPSVTAWIADTLWFKLLLALPLLWLGPALLDIVADMRGERRSLTRLRAAAASLGVILGAWFVVYLAWSDPTVWGIVYLLATLFGAFVLYGVGVFTRLPARIPPQPDLVRLRGGWSWKTALPFALAFALLVPPLWLAAETRAGRQVIAPAQGFERVVATSPEGLIAMSGGPAGRTITIVSTDSPDKVFKTFPDPGDLSKAGGIIPCCGTGPIVSLAVNRIGPAGATDARVVAATADGYIFAFDGDDRPIALFGLDKRGLPVSPPLLAFGTKEIWVAAALHWADGSSSVAVSDLSRETIYASIERPTQRRITALAALPGRHLAWTGANGQATVARVYRGASDLRLLLLDERTSPPNPRLQAGARLIRSVAGVGQGPPRFLAVADDGTALLGTIDAGSGLSTTRVRPLPALALGPVVPWAERAPPPPQPESGRVVPTAQRGGPPVPGAAGPGTTAASERVVQELTKTLLGYGASAGNASGFAGILVTNGRDAGLTTPGRMAAFLALMQAHGGTFRLIEERIPTDAYQLVSIFPRQFPDLASTKGYEGDPESIANRIYAGRMGNGPEASGDGWRYRGRGLLSMAGKANYARAGQQLGVDLVRYPERAAEPPLAMRIALLEWQRIDGNRFADARNLRDLNRRFSGGLSRLDEFTSYFNTLEARMRNWNFAPAATAATAR